MTMTRIAVVTGGTRGIGEAISLALQAQGRTVVANYAGNEEKARAFTERTGIKSYRWDVGDHEATLEQCARIAAEVGPIDIVVNNAGITRDGVLHKMSFDDWNEVMRINLGGCFNMAKATFPGMRERGWGRIVNIGSINGQAGQYGQVNYAAAKSGIHGFTKALAQEGAKYGVTVNAIAPGAVDTPIWDSLDTVKAAIAKHGNREAAIAEIGRAGTPLGRMGSAEEVAAQIGFLLSNLAATITGTVLVSDGGYSI
jgi:acetoacetyl-CoA reductase